MSDYNSFDENVYSEELFNVTESEYDEVIKALAEENEGFQSYSKWSQELKAQSWHGPKNVNEILIKKACEHTTCPHARCAKSMRIGGIEI